MTVEKRSVQSFMGKSMDEPEGMPGAVFVL